MIVVTTPTGLIGHQVVDKVLETGRDVRVIVRDAARLHPHVRERVQVVEGSHGDSGVVAEAFAGADALFWVVPPDLYATNAVRYYRDFTRPACAAVVAQGVTRVVGVSSLGREVSRNVGLVSAAYAMDELIESTGVSYRALRMAAFMEDVLTFQGDSIRTRGVFFGFQTGDRKTPTAATRDIAAVAADLLLDDSWSGQGSAPALGPEDLSFNDMAQIMSDVLGRRVEYQQVAAATYKAALMKNGMGEAYAQGIVDNQAEASRGIYNVEQRSPQSTTPTSFRQWCDEVLKPALLTPRSRGLSRVATPTRSPS